ncbi:GNAT family N-acetyltransferase [Pluralibacter gergoviae]|uniref:GNAT family N-acetyltransferase n=1 Tax=Pluralibacter gergoviae TaxID=61647 RepID=UPI0004F6AD24|nr:GNAT family N-acetyltransferase [Pluralibacter gergoviae]AIR00006.1 acetyltransferase [Pluralibacter gergoviae]EKT9640947.1 GNAT family N-acetyltransferase [Pluralibacter gergoviae]EKV0929277.1 GNAT family N-acetyltransferase [Pluralibacter gergoviae]EKV3543553.1 GNAT family N-acetyltransferase [Pluralibacter gergoviae]EKV9897452.1 GNAT family N-acetyltransferase [Pluralibacter gergoviae]
MPETRRLILRQWQERDLAPFAALNASPEVMHFFPAVMSAQESDALAARLRATIDANRGWGYWAVELKATAQFTGFVGLADQPDRYPFSPCTEISWRLDKKFWHRGIALEAARAALNYAFDVLEREAVVAFTSVHNAPSERLMQRLGMRKQGQFFHPALPREHWLAEHVLYRVERESCPR